VAPVEMSHSKSKDAVRVQYPLSRCYLAVS
jgi:hypothetical protein